MFVAHINNGTEEHLRELVFYFEYAFGDGALHLTYRTEQSAIYDTEYLKRIFKDIEVSVEPYWMYDNTIFKYN